MSSSVIVELSEGAPLRALALWQPWASLVAVGAKRWETRSWRPREIGSCRPRDYRGLLAIVAARTRVVPPLSGSFQELLGRHGLADLDSLPRGAVVALVRVLRVVRTEEIVEFVAGRACTRARFTSTLIRCDDVTAGDWTAGRFGWELELLGVPSTPIPFRAAQGCREAPRELAEQLVRDLQPPPASAFALSSEREKQDTP